jgi:hypothetical protein
MSLLRLLRTGRSWVGSDSERRYQAVGARSMPKFGSKANPFRKTTTPSEKVECAPVKPGASEPQITLPGIEAQPAQVPELPESQPEPVAQTPAESSRPAPAAKANFPAASWTDRALSMLRGALGRLRLPKRQPKPLIPRFNATTQPELSLDSVRVVRNDLSDADLELALVQPPVRPKAAKASEPARVEAGKAAPELERAGAGKP